MSIKENGKLNSQSAKVIQLGFNISVSGNPDTDFQVVLDDKVQGVTQPALQNETQLQPSAELEKIQNAATNKLNQKKETTEKYQQLLNMKSKDVEISPQNSCISVTDSSKPTENSKEDSSTSKELSLINDIKHTVEHFERFSDRLKECPRFRSRPIATSTPFPERENSNSEPSLHYPEIRHKRFNHLYDFNSRKEYFKGSMKPFPSDLYLKPLPGENLYKRGIVARYCDYEPFRYHGSVDSLSKTNEDYNYFSRNYNADSYENPENSSKGQLGILKKSDSESGDKHSTSSADSVKDIKIYQSGGILIMQNFKEGFDVVDKKNISDFSATLIENCKKLKDEIKNDFSNIEEKSGSMNSSDEGKHTGKMVQFDLSECENHKSKSSGLPSDSPIKVESSESTSDCLKIKDSSPQETLQSQDFQSISTQENDSIISNPPGTSPGASSKKLEWDSGADVGYLNLDLSQENLSSIERIVLKGLTSDGCNEKKVVYEKKPNQPHSKFILERLPSDLVIEEIIEEEIVKKDEKDKNNSENFKKSKAGENIISAEIKTKKGEDSVCTKEKINKVCRIPAEGNYSLKSQVEEDCFKGEAKTDKSPSEFKHVESSDKCVNVNTLFNDFIYPLPLCWGSGGGEPIRERNVSETCKFRSSRLPSKTKKLKKKTLSQRPSLTTPLKDKIESIIDIARHSSRSVDSSCERMGIPKKIYRKVEANPQLSDLELSREVEEIIIDQRFKIKQNLALGKESTKERSIDEHIENENKKGNKKRNKPISASSSSNNTAVIINEVPKEKQSKTVEEVKGIDQMVQTCKSEVESIGVQAFSSQKSILEVKNYQEKKPEFYQCSKENINTTSKNIQVFGLNSSLPKHLAHPKETELQNAQNTKSTQFFGGPINSLPNYHCSVTTKPVESCNHMQKEQKISKNIVRDLTRLQEKNVKNILDKENIPQTNEPERNFSGQQSDVENKENLTKSSFKDHTSISEKISIKNNVNTSSQKVNKSLSKNNMCEPKKKTRAEKDIVSQNDSNDVNTSDEVSSKILTSEVLKEHGNSIDRNIIKEKYFQSQLIELEKREMISKSTSMERLFEEKRNELVFVKENVTVACQYSPQSKGHTSDGGSKSPELNADTDKLNTNSQRREGSDQYDSSQNLMEEEHFGPSKETNQEQDFGTGDSCPSSTQTAHSWIPGIQDPEQNKKSVIGRARSFEYLPGHIYECSGNLREELPSDVEPNITTGSSSSSSENNGANHSSSGEGKISEGRKTLVLENSNDTSGDSDRLKSLNENLTKLDLVVEKLKEKDAEIQNITRSLLINFWRTNGSGDGADVLAIPSTPRKLEINYIPIDEESPKQSGDSSLKTRTFEKPKKEKEISIACQTEDKSSSPSQKTFSGERKVLESRIAAEKQNQIKWIENEIHHLNILRNLLEKQNKSTERKQNQSDLLKIDKKNLFKNIETEKYPQSSELVEEPIPSNKDRKVSDENNISTKTQSSLIKENKMLPLVPDTNYGMAVSLVGRVRKVMMFPIGVEFNLNDPELRWRCSASSDADSDMDQRHSGRPLPCVSRVPKSYQASNSMTGRHYPSQDFTEYSHTQMITSHNVNTQFPSVERTSFTIGPSQTISVQTDFSVFRNCKKCHQDICVCLSLSKSDKSDATASGFSKENSNSSEKKESLKMNFNNRNESVENKTQSRSTTPEVVEIINCSKNSNGASKGSNGRRLCKCENCPKRNSSVQRSGIIYTPTSATSQNPSPSNIYVTCEKSNEIGLSKCSRVQIERSANCACHIIKIHDSKCCSSEGRTYSPKNRNGQKIMESQASQTEYVTFERKNLITNSEVVKPPKAPEKKYRMENKVGIEAKRSVEKKFPYKPKVSIERRYPCLSRIKVKEKYGVPKESSNCIIVENDEALDEISECKCGCRKSLRKEKIQEGDHPRSYFLKIEEKEIDDSNESLANRPSLDVITVTVPVKRNKKSKITGNKNLRSHITNQCSLESMESYEKNGDCNCCQRCIGRFCLQISQQYETQMKDQYQKTKAEKPSSPNENDRPYSKALENCYEEVIDCGESSSKDFGRNAQLSSSQEYYHYREPVNSMKSDTYFSRPASGYSVSYNGFQQSDKRNKYREPQIDYDSHKEYGSLNSFCNGIVENEEVKPRAVLRDDKRYYYPSEPDKSNQCFEDRFQSDYYNYDKKEFMTKSEMQKEEIKKKKVHQPTLQECLESNRPDFYSKAETRRRVIAQRAKERERKQKLKMECLMSLMHHCNESDQLKNNAEPRRMFTTSQMKEQTNKLYKKLPEVTGKIADEKKRQEYRTNKLMADVYAKKLQLEALKGSCECYCEE